MPDDTDEGRQLEARLRSPLFTDLYDLTMAQAYEAERMCGEAVFELTFRKMPEPRNYIVAAGIGDVLDFLTNFRFSASDLEFLGRRGGFSREFLTRLESLQFTGDVYAMPEGSIVFQNEPLVQIVAPIVEAQLVETFVLNQIHFQSLAAAKASRIVESAQGRTVVDFGSRRSHGTDAALKVARATYLAGGHGTSNVLAGKLYSIPVFGTLAHSYIQAHDDESAAFEAFAAVYPGTTLLVDTYDTIEGVRKVIELKRRLGERFRVSAVRLDSGDLGSLAVESRRMFDEAGLMEIKIFASSGLDEYKVQNLVRSGAPIDGFGVGTNLAVMEDAPALDMAYKLVEYGGKGRLKLSSKKVLYPWRKQVFRQSENGHMIRDVVGRFDEPISGEPLLQPMLRRFEAPARIDVNESRKRLERELGRLPNQYRRLDKADTPYPVTFSDRLQCDLASLRSQFERVTR